MPKVTRAYTQKQLSTSFGQITQLDAVSVVFFADCISYVNGELSSLYKLQAIETVSLVRVLNAFLFDKTLSKTLLLTLLFGSPGYWEKLTGSVFASFFFLDSNNRYALSPTGNALIAYYVTTLRRVCSDRQYFFELKYGRFTPAQREKRRLAKRFYKDLTEAQQIAVLRAYWSLPFRNDDEKRVRRLARLDMLEKYDLRNWDVINAVQRFGDIVKSVRKRPDLIDLFPVYRKPGVRPSLPPSDNSNP